jgi:phospholipid/cholesterol/gamma-HCH transport system ATP-binding protein
VVTHDRDLAFNIADRIAFVMDGKIRGVGKPADFKNPTDPVIANFLNPVIDLKNPRFKQLENSHE